MEDISEEIWNLQRGFMFHETRFFSFDSIKDIKEGYDKALAYLKYYSSCLGTVEGVRLANPTKIRDGRYKCRVYDDREKIKGEFFTMGEFDIGKRLGKSLPQIIEEGENRFNAKYGLWAALTRPQRIGDLEIGIPLLFRNVWRIDDRNEDRDNNRGSPSPISKGKFEKMMGAEPIKY